VIWFVLVIFGGIDEACGQLIHELKASSGINARKKADEVFDGTGRSPFTLYLSICAVLPSSQSKFSMLNNRYGTKTALILAFVDKRQFTNKATHGRDMYLPEETPCLFRLITETRQGAVRSNLY
jgi:hypothetical protein